MMLLEELINSDDYNLSQQDLSKKVDFIDIDSRRIRKNSIFFALPGKLKNGADFVDSAVSNGQILLYAESFWS